MKFTFKTTKASGYFDSDYHAIKLSGIKCGYIKDERPYRVFMLITKNESPTINSPTKWRWARIKTPAFETIQEAKSWLKEHSEEIIEYFDKKGEPIWLVEE